jgi:hypothetical protein
MFHNVIKTIGPIPVAARSKAEVLAAWLQGSLVRIPLGHGCLSLCLYVVLSCVGRGLCDGVTTRPKESNQVSKIHYESFRVRRQGPYKDSRATDDDDD